MVDEPCDINGKMIPDESQMSSLFNRSNSDMLPILRQPKELLSSLPPSNAVGVAPNSNYRWQGIEAVLESYQRYLEGILISFDFSCRVCAAALYI